MIVVKKSTGRSVTRLVEAYNAAMAISIPEKRAKIDARLHIPLIDPNRFTNLTVSKKTVEYQKTDYTGEVLISDVRSEELPTLRAGKVTHTASLHFLGVQLEKDPNEIDAIQGGDIIPVADTNEAVEVILRQENKILYEGYKPLGRIGLANIPGRRIFSVATGAGGTEWDKKTGAEILKDIIDLIAEFESDGKHIADKLLVNKKYWPILQNDYSDKSSVSIETRIKGLISDLQYSTGIVDDSGEAGVALLEDSPENFGFIEVESASAQKEYPKLRNMVTPIEEKISEVIAFDPEAIMFADGII